MIPVILILHTHWPELCIVCCEKGKPWQIEFPCRLAHGQWVSCSGRYLVKEPQCRQNIRWRRLCLISAFHFTHLRQKIKIKQTRMNQLNKHLLHYRAHKANIFCRQFLFTGFLLDIKTNFRPAAAAHLRTPVWCVIIITSGVCEYVRKRETGSGGGRVDFRYFTKISVETSEPG